jgi:hypothetical protein
MTIQYSQGKAREAVLLSRTETTLRAAVAGADDVLVFSNVNGVWISEDWEPVQIVFEWQRGNFKANVTEADCICSQDLAARLIRLLFSEESATPARVDSPSDPDSLHLLT